MKKYIDREVIKQRLYDCIYPLNKNNPGLYQALLVISDMPTVDIVDAHWKLFQWRNSISCAICSFCGAEAHHAKFRGVQKYYKFCPNCGAKMDGGGEQ